MGKVRLTLSDDAREAAARWQSPRSPGCHLASVASGAEVDLSALWADMVGTIEWARKFENPGVGSRGPLYATPSMGQDARADMGRLWEAICEFIADYADWEEDEPEMVCAVCGERAENVTGVWNHGGFPSTLCTPPKGTRVFRDRNRYLLPVPGSE